MIQRLQYSPVHFTNNGAAQQAATPKTEDKKEVAQQPKEKASFTETFNRVKKAGTDIIKDVNIFTNTSGGALRGVVDGTITTVAIASIGKSLKNSKNEKGLKVLGSIAKNLLQDGWNGIKGTASYAKRLLTEDKAAYKHALELLSLPKKFYCNYMKNNKLIAAGATAAGLAIFAVRTLQGKINANEKNAKLDHKTNQGHI